MQLYKKQKSNQLPKSIQLGKNILVLWHLMKLLGIRANMNHNLLPPAQTVKVILRKVNCR